MTKALPKFRLFAAILLAFLPLSGEASLVFSDRFDDHPAGVLPHSPNGRLWSDAPSGAVFDNDKDLLARVEIDTGNLFGAGTENHYLRLSDTNFERTPGAAQIVGVNGLDFGETGQISFDFYKPSIPTGLNEPLDEGNGYLFRFGLSRFNSGTAFAISIQKGGLFATVGEQLSVQKNPFVPFENDTPHHLVIVFNNSALAIEYGNQRQLQPGSMDVWLNGVLVGIGLPRTGGLPPEYSGPLKSFSFGQKLNFVGELFIDNFEISREITLKE